MYTISAQDYGVSYPGDTRFERQALGGPSGVTLMHSGARSIGFAALFTLLVCAGFSVCLSPPLRIAVGDLPTAA